MWIGPVIGFLVGGVVAGLFLGDVRHTWEEGSVAAGALVVIAASIGVAVRTLLRRRAATPPPPVATAVPVSPIIEEPRPAGSTNLDRGVEDIRVTDRGFDPTRFAGYAAMLFRDVQRAVTTRDVGALRDRVTPEMYRELHAVCDGLRAARRSSRVEDVEIRPEVTEAWQDGDRDYVTAYIAGSMVDYTVDDATGALVDGSRAMPTPVEEFLTFTRPAGLNFWMLSAIQSA